VFFIFSFKNIIYIDQETMYSGRTKHKVEQSSSQGGRFEYKAR
jgi:hypothetical protein